MPIVNSELKLWTTTCGCPKPAIHWSSDFNARVCQNCGTIITVDERKSTAIQQDMHEHDEEEELPKTFVHLRVHTHYSLLQSTVKIDDLISKTKEHGMPAVAKVELGNMHGVPSFVKDCTDAGIKPIVGTTFNINVPKDKVERYHPITLIALDNIGYRSLVRLTTMAWCETFSKKLGPVLDITKVQKLPGLVALVGVHGVEQHDFVDILVQVGSNLTSEVYIELTKHYAPQDSHNMQVAYAAADQTKMSYVVTNGVLYTEQDDWAHHRVALKIGKHDTIPPGDPEYWFKPPNEMFNLGFPIEAYENAIKIADRVQDYKLINKDFIVPTFKDKVGHEWGMSEVNNKLEMDCFLGLSAKGLADRPDYVKRLEHELKIMKDKNFSSYFLIISEIIEYMKTQNMLKPIGRGSSVGSMVCYALDITSMDPIRWGIPFERFINAGRVDLPDIDTDITQDGRGQVLKHIADVHGHDRVAQIATFQTMALKSAIDSVGRALDVPAALNKELRNLISDDAESFDDVPPGVKSEMAAVPGWADGSIALCGVSKNLGYHAAGIVIANEALGNIVPLMPDDEGMLAIQYDMRDIEVLGLLKLDMLGLKNLDIIQHTLKEVKDSKGIDIDIYNLPVDDKPTYDLIGSGEYVSIFQLDSWGYRALCRRLKPENFDNIMALNALYRPGPLEGGMTDEFVERRHGRKELIGWHPWLDEVMSPTYQVPLYQEQVMAIAKIIAGFDDVGADNYRKAIGKKDAEKFEKAQKKFKEGALKREGLKPPAEWTGSLEGWIDDLLHRLAGYARYGWNIGHSAGYGWITYITAYLEAHHSLAYYASLLDANSKKTDNTAELIRSIQKRGIQIIPPEINESGHGYTVGTDGRLYMGLAAVRGIAGAIPDILKERETRGKFGSFVEFCQRLPSVTKTAKVNMVKAGAFKWDKIICDRDKVDNIDIINDLARKRTKKFDGSRASPYDIIMQLSLGGNEYTDIQFQRNERDVLSSFITGHPAAVYQRLAPVLESGSMKVVCPSMLSGCGPGDAMLMIGMVDNMIWRTIQSGRNEGKPYLIIVISDQTSNIRINVWDPLCHSIGKHLVEGGIAMFGCKARPDRFRQGEITLSVSSATILTDGLPVYGITGVNGIDLDAIASSFGGEIEGRGSDGVRKIASLKKRLTVPADLVEEVVTKHTGTKFLISFGVTDGAND